MSDRSNRYEQPRHPIQVVSQRTGLSKDVIRIWERRHKVIEPGRSSSGRRIYTDAHIDRLLKLKEATAGGRRIGDLAHLSSEELAELVASDRQSRVETARDAAGFFGTEESHAARCMAAIEAVDPVQLEARLAAASVAMSVPKLLDDLLAPLLTEIGRRWHLGELRIGQEHLASSVIHTFLDNLRRTASMHAHGPIVLVTTPSGHNHELGALMAAVAAATAGWQTVYLNPNTPAADIVATALQVGARAVALSLVYPAGDAGTVTDLRFLRDQLGGETAVIVGGHAVPSYQPVLDEIRAIPLSRFSEIGEALGGIRTGAIGDQ
jgi:DNA-binding transcriptional MerR regulator/methylmalonyl-CoA mutase cobalamin-binding subunit